MAELPAWASVVIAIFERVGVGCAVLVFLAAVVWKVLPPLTKLLRAWKAQADKITDAVPRVEADFRALVGNVRDVNDRFERVEDKLDRSLSAPCPHIVPVGSPDIRGGSIHPGPGGGRGVDLSSQDRP